VLKEEEAGEHGLLYDGVVASEIIEHVAFGDCHYDIFTCPIPFLSPNQLCRSTEGTANVSNC